jgi:hypothetical protein
LIFDRTPVATSSCLQAPDVGLQTQAKKFKFDKDVTMGAHPTAPQGETKSLTSADLAFIDAAIAMYKATEAAKGKEASQAHAVSVEPESFLDIISVITAVVQVATFVYHAWKGRVLQALPSLEKTSVSGTASLHQLIEKRNELAKKLGDKSVLS